MNRKLTILVSLLCLIILAAIPVGAAPLHSAALRDLVAAPCAAGQVYDPACDVDHDNDVDIFDIQLTASRWNTNGLWVADGWSLTGNAGTTPGANFIGTTDNQPLEVKVNGQRALRIEPGADGPNLIGGAAANVVTSGVRGATIAGGGRSNLLNQVTDDWGTVGGGAGNQAGGDSGSLGEYATVAGGNGNEATAYMATVSGGSGNAATGQYSFVGGGLANNATATHAVILAGSNNSASGTLSVVLGGFQNSASGDYAVVPGGSRNTAAAPYSFAAGRRAKANHTGAFVLADSSDFDLASTTANSLRARFTGGMRMIVAIDANGNYTVNCLLSQSTLTWSCSSGLDVGDTAEAVDAAAILDQVSALPVLTWRSGEEGVRHIGPMAEDFHTAFGLGQPGEGISTIDLDGVALASIQALHQMVREKDAEIASLEARLVTLEQVVQQMQAGASGQ